MKKKLVIIFIIAVTIICTLLFNNIFFNCENYVPTIYQLSENQNNISDITTLQSQKLKLTLKGFYYDKLNNENLSNLGLDESTITNILKFSDNKQYNLLINFSTTDGNAITEPIFDYLVYDNLGNVIITSMVYERSSKKTNQFLKYFMEKEHSSNNLLEFSNYNLSSGTTQQTFSNADNSNLILISSLNNNNIQKEFDLSKVHILILNPSYKTTTNNDRIYLDDTIFEFILEN